jgi:hypothetical protein
MKMHAEKELCQVDRRSISNHVRGASLHGLKESAKYQKKLEGVSQKRHHCDSDLEEQQ